MNKQMKTLDGVYFNDVTARQQIAGKADRVHTHSFNQLTNKPQIPEQYDDTQLRQQIAGKANANHTHSYDDLTDKPQAGESYDDTQLRQQIAGKANAVHTHSYNNLTDKPTIPEGYDDTQVKSDIVSLNTAIVTLGNAKQDVISDLSTIRSGASAGADALPKNPDNWPTMTDAQKDTACSVMGAERAKGDWVLKGTIDGSVDTITVDLEGCTELIIHGKQFNASSLGIKANNQTYICYHGSSLKGFLSRAIDNGYLVEFESRVTSQEQTPQYYTQLMSNNYYITNLRISQITSIKVNVQGATTCDIKIYAR